MQAPSLRGGLSSVEAAARLRARGPNALPEVASPTFVERALRQFRSALIYLLLFALVFDLGAWVHSGAAGVPLEALAILSVLLLNAGLGVLQEYRSEHALVELRALGAPQVWTLRDGELARIPVQMLVAGDLVRLEAGDRVPADGVALEPHGLSVDESVLTGESLAIEKNERDELFAGTLVVRGKCLAAVTRTGPASAMGKVATALGEVQAVRTPLERRIDALGAKVAVWVAVVSVCLLAGGLLVEGIDQLNAVVLFAVAFGVAVVPEGMPAVLTLALAFGVQRMAKRNAVIRRLASVEALGSVSVIASDKTGTLTENRIAVAALETDEEARAVNALVLANDADPGLLAGDPIDVSLLDYASRRGHDPEALRCVHPRISARPFDSAWKYVRVTVETEHGPRAYVKGAVEVVLGRSRLAPEARAAWQERASEWASRGFKVLGLATGPGESETELEFLGFVSLWDAPRPEAPGAVRRAQDAGIRVLMITGDHPTTARAIAERVGIGGDGVLEGDELDRLSHGELALRLQRTRVFARMRPEHKLRVVTALQAQGEIVAMTGDGLNDAPALKRADVGVAMGKSGSDVAREVSDIVLLDDDFATIVAAVEEGRVIYENIQKFIRFTFSTNVALMLIVLGGAVGSLLVGLRTPEGALLLPLTAIQILWINFLGDGPPALALAVDRNPGVLGDPPRRADAPLLDRESRRFVLATGLLQGSIGLAMLAAFPLFGFDLAATASAVFLYQSVAKLLNVYPSRRLAGTVRANPWLVLSVVAGVALQAACFAIPWLRGVLGLVALDARALLATAVVLLVGWALAELVALRLRTAPRRAQILRTHRP